MAAEEKKTDVEKTSLRIGNGKACNKSRENFTKSMNRTRRIRQGKENTIRETASEDAVSYDIRRTEPEEPY